MHRRAEGTLILVVVIMISAIAMPSLSSQRANDNEERCQYLLGTLVTINEHYKTRFGSYAGDLRDLGIVEDLVGQLVRVEHDPLRPGQEARRPGLAGGDAAEHPQHEGGGAAPGCVGWLVGALQGRGRC